MLDTPRLAALFVFLSAAPLAAQEDAAFTLTPHLGLQVAPGALYEVDGTFAPSGYQPPVSSASIGPGAVVGADMEVVLWPGAPLRLRFGGRHVLFARAEVEGTLEPLDPADPGITRTFDLDAVITIVSGGIVYRPPAGDRKIRGHAVLGVGLKNLIFGEAAEDTLGIIFPAGGASATIHVGAGLDLLLAPVTLTIGVDDYVNGYIVERTFLSSRDERTQHTVTVTLGVTLELGALTPASSPGPSPPRR